MKSIFSIIIIFFSPSFIYFFPCKHAAAPLGAVILHGHFPISVRPGVAFRRRF